MKVSELTVEQLERSAAILRAMAHPARIGILSLLEEGAQLTVTEIQEKLGIEQSAASHHLGILRDKGILATRREGRCIRYFLRFERLGQILECVGDCSISRS